MAGQQRFFDPSQPQTLQIATILLYIEAAFFFLRLSPLGLLFAAAFAGGAYGMANGKKWGYIVSLAMTVLWLATFLIGQTMTSALNDPIGLMFAIALVALLAHPQTREYQKIWFS